MPSADRGSFILLLDERWGGTMNRKRLCLIIDVASLVICLIPLAWFLLRASKLPDVVPVHFGFGNVPTRFGGKWEYLFMPLFSIGVIIFGICCRHFGLSNVPGVYTREKRELITAIIVLVSAVLLDVSCFHLFFLAFSR